MGYERRGGWFGEKKERQKRTAKLVEIKEGRKQKRKNKNVMMR